jgi:hypothetical protein
MLDNLWRKRPAVLHQVNSVRVVQRIFPGPAGGDVAYGGDCYCSFDFQVSMVFLEGCVDPVVKLKGSESAVLHANPPSQQHHTPLAPP